jgi:hypothetical protein
MGAGPRARDQEPRSARADPVGTAKKPGAASATPRLTNRGVASTERITRANRLLVDWVEWTEHEASVDVVCGRLGEDWTEGEKGALGYRRSRISASKAIAFYDGQPGMGVHVRASGSACRVLEGQGVIGDWERFLSSLLVSGRSITRLDVALDDKTGTVTVERCYAAEKAGHLVRRFRKAAAFEYLDGDGRTQSRTLNFGSTKSALSVRIYDKALQTGQIGPWTRVEVQARDDRGVALARKLVVEDPAARARAFGGLLLYYLDFKTASRDGNRSRWPTAAWWSEFVESTAKRKLDLEPKPLPTAEEAMSAVAQQYGPVMAALVEVGGYGPLFEAVESSRVRWGPRHLRLLNNWRAAG